VFAVGGLYEWWWWWFCLWGGGLVCGEGEGEGAYSALIVGGW
jgi:hypothetical protein